MKAPSICQSLLCPDPVSFPVLSQIKPQAPDLLQIGNANFPRFRKGLGLYLKQQIKSATHNHLVSEPSTCAFLDVQEAWLRIVQSLALLPYPRPLTWCCTPFHNEAAVARALRSFPQFGCVAPPPKETRLAINFV